MKEKKKIFNKAGKNEQRNNTQKMLACFGEVVGVTQTEIQKLVNKKRNRLVNYVLLVVLTSVTSLSYLTYLSLHYRGSSVQDFQMVERLMRGFFGRFY
jgi:hypothetical protein